MRLIKGQPFHHFLARIRSKSNARGGSRNWRDDGDLRLVALGVDNRYKLKLVSRPSKTCEIPSKGKDFAKVVGRHKYVSHIEGEISLVTIVAWGVILDSTA